MKKRNHHESDLNKRIQHAIRDLDPKRVENVVDPGMPDIAYVGGWIESKYLAAWPKGAVTPVRCDHYRPDQRAWHVRHCGAGGVCHVVLQIGARDVLVMDGRTAAARLGLTTKSGLLQAAMLHMQPWNAGEFRQFIEQRRLAQRPMKW